MSFGGIARALGIGQGRSEGEATEAAILASVARGGARFERLVWTRNRRVMASIAGDGRTLRLSRAFTDAPVEVLAEVGRIFASRSPAARTRARAAIRSYLAETNLPAAAPASSRPAPHRVRARDRPHVERLRAAFDRINRDFFGGRLPDVPLRLSSRMRRRNGHFSADPLEIAISRRLLEHGAEGEAERTLRHEMIHVWQWVDGRKPGHGADFRRWARRLDIHPRATRTVRWIEAA